MSPIIHPDIWMHCQLSVAAHAGGCIVNGKRYVVHKSGYLVREDFVGVVNSLGAETVRKAIERYKPDWYAKAVCQRLKRIIRAQKRASICNDSVLF